MCHSTEGTIVQTAELENWIKALPVEEVRQQIRDLELQLARAKQALALYESLSNGAAPATVEPQGGSGSQQTLGASPSKPAAISAVLRDRHPEHVTPGAILEALIANGWVADTRRARRGFYATMSRLNGEGRILRHPDGGYTLPPDSSELP